MEQKLTKPLHDAGLRATKGRIAVFTTFSTGCHPLSAETVYARTRKTGLDLVTVYRTLHSFESKGIIRRVDIGGGATMYELALHHHHHIVCTSCGRIERFDDCKMDGITKRILNESHQFAHISRHSLELFGLCKKCDKIPTNI